LQVSEQRYRSLVDDLDDIIVEATATGEVCYVNPAATRLSGVPAEQIIGRDMLAHVHPDDRAMAAEHGTEGVAGGGAAREARFIAADGSLRWMSVRGRLSSTTTPPTPASAASCRT